MTWNSAFFGTAIISVRALGCAQNSAWLDTRVEVIQQTNPPVVASSLSFPSALTLFLGDSFGGIPNVKSQDTLTHNLLLQQQTVLPISLDSMEYRKYCCWWGREEKSNAELDFDTGVMHWNLIFMVA